MEERVRNIVVERAVLAISLAKEAFEKAGFTAHDDSSTNEKVAVSIIAAKIFEQYPHIIK